MPKRRLKRRSTPARVPPRAPTRAKSKKARKKASKRELAAAKKRRSEAAKQGWDKRRKRQRLIEAMADRRWKVTEDAQPIGWRMHRADVREINGEIWREIAVEFSEDAYEAQRLAALADLEIDMLTKFELYDYLAWLGEEYDIDISDMYRMYLGYPVGEAAV